jgi:hypothetical protein
MALAPKVDAMSNSRTKPVMRDARVSRETIEADLISDTAGSVASPHTTDVWEAIDCA